MSANIGWLFYKDYFKGINYKDLKNKGNEKTVQDKVLNIIKQTPKIEDDEVLGDTHLKATTTYPGLLLGSGNAHELPSIEGQVILGFHFDYTTGLPVIQGSSIKGVLRSVFKHWEYVAEYSGLKTKDEVEALEKEIFDNGDIFHDAVIIKADSYDKILGDDFLAPHGDDPLKNPIPLRFIKVLPNVTFRFDFELSDGLIKKDEKRKLFENILRDLGLGAKTNVGYGKFENFKEEKTSHEIEQEKIEQEKKREIEAQKRDDELKKIQAQKVQKAQGVTQLKTCKDIKQAMKILNDSLGKKAKPTAEQQDIIQQFWNKNSKKASKSEVKFFKKFGV